MKILFRLFFSCVCVCVRLFSFSSAKFTKPSNGFMQLLDHNNQICHEFSKSKNRMAALKLFWNFHIGRAFMSTTAGKLFE